MPPPYNPPRELIKAGYVWVSPIRTPYLLCHTRSGLVLICDPLNDGCVALHTGRESKFVFTQGELLEMFTNEHSHSYKRGWRCAGKFSEVILNAMNAASVT